MGEDNQQKMTLGIVGSGRGGLEMLKLLSGSYLVDVVFMVDRDSKAVGMVETKARRVSIQTDLVATMKQYRTDFINEVTGSAKLYDIQCNRDLPIKCRA